LQATDRLTVKDTKLQLEGRDHGAAVEVRHQPAFLHFLINKGKEIIVYLQNRENGKIESDVFGWSIRQAPSLQFLSTFLK
jgi:hypothetical protein